MKIGIYLSKQREGVYDDFRHITPSFSITHRIPHTYNMYIYIRTSVLSVKRM